MTVDDRWCLVGSANWDARSLRLNFEFNVECYCKSLTAELNRHIEEKLKSATQVHLDAIEKRPRPIKIRDAAVRLLSPIL